MALSYAIGVPMIHLWSSKHPSLYGTYILQATLGLSPLLLRPKMQSRETVYIIVKSMCPRTRVSGFSCLLLSSHAIMRTFLQFKFHFLTFFPMKYYLVTLWKLPKITHTYLRTVIGTELLLTQCFILFIQYPSFNILIRTLIHVGLCSPF